MLNKRAFSTVEYIVLIIVIISALIIFRPMFERYFFGRWRATGESFSFGRQYDSKETIACAYMMKDEDNGVWYDEACWENNQCQANDVACYKKMGCAKVDFECERNYLLSQCQRLDCSQDPKAAKTNVPKDSPQNTQKP